MKQFTLKAFGLLALLFAFGWVQAQKNEQPSTLNQAATNPAGYDAAKADWVATHPTEYQAMNQGDAKVVDTQATPWGAAENKEQWISQHPREYAEMTAVKADNRTIMTKEQLATFPAEKQAAIKNDPNFNVIEQ